MPYLAPIALLFASNLFMTFARYGLLKYPNTPAMAGDLHKMEDCIVRILLRSARQSHRPSRLFCRLAQDHAGDHHAFGVWRIFGHLDRRKPKIKPYGGIDFLMRGGVFFLP